LSNAAATSGGRPLRFCLLSTFYPPWNFGGDGIHVERLAHALADRGHRVTVVCAPKAHRILSRERPAEPPPHPGVEIVSLPDGLASLTGVYMSGRPLRSRRLLRRLLNGGFDVLHFHNPSLLGAPELLGMGEGLRLYTTHEQWLLCPSHLLWRRGGRVCEDPPCWSCELSHLRPPQPWRRTGLLERSVRRLDAVIAPSRTTARLHERFAPLTRLEVIEYFVPEPPAGEDARPSGPRRRYFLYAGRLEPIKGVGSLVEAFRSRRSEDLVIAGDGGEARRLRRAARDLPHVQFAGRLSHEELTRLYREAIAVVVPTLGHETGPLVPLEAFAVGTPAIVHSFGALEELAGRTGAAIAYRSPEDLRAALDRLAGDGRLRDDLGRRGKAEVEERHTACAHLDRYLRLIASLAHERGNSELATAAQAATASLEAPSRTNGPSASPNLAPAR
jgi:glycosyltransferase involved in cell wall biosynthesis